MKQPHPLRWLHGKWRILPLTDRCLLIFMCILLAQSAHNLFFHELASKSMEALDAMIRTTSAAIFGYFISGGYGGGQDPSKKKKTNQPDPPTETGKTAKGLPPCGCSRRAQEQILIVTAIGLFCLITLILARNYAQITPVAAATLSQLRDFVSGSVGFLIGHPEKKEK